MTVKIVVTESITIDVGGGQWEHRYQANVTCEGDLTPPSYSYSVPGTITAGGIEDTFVSFRVTNSNSSGATGWGTASVTVDSGGCSVTESTNVAGARSGGTTDTTGPQLNWRPIILADGQSIEFNFTEPIVGTQGISIPGVAAYFGITTGRSLGIPIASNGGQTLTFPIVGGPICATEGDLEAVYNPSTGNITDTATPPNPMVFLYFDSTLQTNSNGVSIFNGSQVLPTFTIEKTGGPRRNYALSDPLAKWEYDFRAVVAGYGIDTFEWIGPNGVIQPGNGNKTMFDVPYANGGAVSILCSVYSGRVNSADGFFDQQAASFGNAPVVITDPEIIAPTGTKWACLDSVCTLVEYDADSGLTYYDTKAQCQAAGCEPAPCTLSAVLEVEDLGGENYRLRARVENGPTATATWQRDGAPIASETPLTALATVARDASALFVATVTDGACSVVEQIWINDNDEGGRVPVACPAGQHDNGTGVCVPDEVTPGPQPCAAGFHWDAASLACVRDIIGPQPCAAGYHWDATLMACVIDIDPPPPCPIGQHWDGTACVPVTEPQTCATGYQWNGTQCIPIPIEPPPPSCPLGQHWNGIACVPNVIPPEPVVCAPTLAITTPAANATLKRFARVVVAVADANEELDPCSRNYNRACNHEAGGHGLLAWLADYQLTLAWELVSGSPLNGTWAAWLDTGDFSNGEHDLRVSARGVGCCRVEATRAVTLQNTLFGNIFYRDIRAQARPGYVIPRAHVGIEMRALEENTSRRCWVQHAVRSGTALDGPYRHEDWPRHQPILLVQGETQTAQGLRIARAQWGAPVVMNLPHEAAMRARQKWTPQFWLAAFDLNAQTVAKIRPMGAGKHAIFTTNPARVWTYDGEVVTIAADLSLAPAPDEGELGENETEGDFDFVDKSAANFYAPFALDVAVTSSKIYVVTPPETDTPRGSVFAFDTDAGEVALVYTVRGELREPRLVESVGTRVLALYVHDEATALPIASKRTRCYDLSFDTPKLLWQIAPTATRSAVAGAKFLIAAGAQLWVSQGGAAPVLDHAFGAAIMAMSDEFVGLNNGEVWKRTGTTWSKVLTRTSGAIGGVATWNAGTTGEASGQSPARGIVGGANDWLAGEKENGSWYDEVELRLPLDLATKTVDGVSALELFSLELPPLSSDGDAAATPQRDERILVGTLGGVLFVYQRSALSERDGAIATSHTAAPRVVPFPMPAPVAVS